MLHEGLDDVVDGAVPPGGDEQIPALVHLLPYQLRDVEATDDVDDFEP